MKASVKVFRAVDMKTGKKIKDLFNLHVTLIPTEKPGSLGNVFIYGKPGPKSKPAFICASNFGGAIMLQGTKGRIRS